MGGNVQPIVADSQHLIVVRPIDTLQPMVVKSRDETKTEFSKRLNSALDSLDKSFECPPTGPYEGRVQWLAARFHVSNEAARKWLSGESIPDQTHLLMIIEDLTIRPSQLIGGLDEKGVAADHFGVKLIRLWGELTDEVKGKMVAFAEVNAATTPQAPKRSKKVSAEILSLRPGK